MFICNAKPDYNWRDKLAKLDGVTFRTFINRAPSFREHVLSKRKDALGNRDDDHSEVSQAEATDKGFYILDGLLMDEHEVEAWTSAGVEVSMSRVKGLASNARELQKTIFQVSVAGIGLLQIQCVDVLEDCCTYELQKWLDKGWRILAVCPPNDARRPSYVMGHVEKEPHR